jgi:hypothetical protein
MDYEAGALTTKFSIFNPDCCFTSKILKIPVGIFYREAGKYRNTPHLLPTNLRGIKLYQVFQIFAEL